MSRLTIVPDERVARRRSTRFSPINPGPLYPGSIDTREDLTTVKKLVNNIAQIRGNIPQSKNKITPISCTQTDGLCRNFPAR